MSEYGSLYDAMIDFVLDLNEFRPFLEYSEFTITKDGVNCEVCSPGMQTRHLTSSYDLYN